MRDLLKNKRKTTETKKIRNTAGQQCTLREYCSEEPGVVMLPIKSMSDAEWILPELKAILKKANTIAEIIKAFDLRQNPTVCNLPVVPASMLRVKIFEQGTFLAINSFGSDTLDSVISAMQRRVEIAEEMAGKWAAVEYQIEEEF